MQFGRRRRTQVLVVAGALAIAASYLLVVADGQAGPVAALRGFAVDVVTGFGSSGITWLLALVGGGYAVFRLARGRDRQAVAPEFVERDPERARLGARRTDDGFESELRRVTRFAEDPDRDGEEVRRRLREIAVGVLTTIGGHDRETAMRSLREGTWTDDRIAAAYLGDDSAPDYPLSARVRGWIRPDLAVERRVERTVDAIHDRSRELSES